MSAIKCRRMLMYPTSARHASF
ncbi:hypothetical protein D3H65_24220 [Paraflavitalea soli]|uniref:Uncharacterized protein n=1 Tax=Paraflavitalea soli TaxID=2315862 RepID=A0A3B7N3X2_9BACT|nr:hypothetical protein D3H65_24220 [Paraflavitalea soli]